MLRSYVQGDDYVLGQSTSAPGQALAVNLTTTNTVCAGTVATTTIPVDAAIPAGRAASWPCRASGRFRCQTGLRTACMLLTGRTR
jgi:hypothetical protein